MTGNRFYIFTGNMLLGEMSNSYTVDVTYTNGPDGLISKHDVGAGNSYWYEFGPQSDTRSLTNGSGTVTDSYSYNAYGETLSSSGSTINPYRFGGKFGYYTESSTSLILGTYRWYASQLMRWIKRGPINYAGGENLYEYVSGRPSIFLDPTGLYHCTGNADCNFNQDTQTATTCFDSCTHRNTAVTCGTDSHGPNDPHTHGNAVDIGRNGNPDLTRESAEHCKQVCFPNGYGQEETNGTHPGTHYHLQVTLGLGGAHNFAPGIIHHI